MQKITDNVYVETGFTGCNVSFVVTGEGVVMIDTPMGPSEAVKWRDEVAKHGPVRYVINTEPHIDHFTGDRFFGGTLITHEGARAWIQATPVEQIKASIPRSDTKSLALLEGFSFRPPDITFTERSTFYLGKHTFRLTNLPGHTPFQSPVFVPEEKVLFTSDNVVNGRQPYLKDALPYEWLRSLEKMKQIEADVLVPGHGKVCDRSFIPEMSAGLQAWIDAVSAAIKKGMSLEEAQEKVSLLDRYPMMERNERTLMVHRMNIARLYEVLRG